MSLPTEFINQRGVHDIHRAFAFASNPQFIFHDSPGFEKGGAKELEDVQQFIENRAKATNVEDQLHAVWFCLVTDAARPVLELEERFFREKRFGNVIAIFTKFDDLVTQLYDEDREEAQIYRDATAYVEDKFQKPLAECNYPPSAYLCFEAMQEPNGNHQQQVKELMKKTADSLGDPAMKLLFVSIQQNNLELCIKYAVKYTEAVNFTLKRNTFNCLQWFCHVYVSSVAIHIRALMRDIAV
ncbi:hypothetical protein D9758_008307 [Tetrapyrgos nigripes]|uniref:G domain-containing protein n=1 Tax=Tetrapyrgos nigripes TaxID=182062 RepID=A0A8H5LN28_9AGAR|nr:hypothetical protein D9758_008307 [Tetrapyrgos nigripes]